MAEDRLNKTEAGAGAPISGSAGGRGPGHGPGGHGPGGLRGRGPVPKSKIRASFSNVSWDIL